MTNTFMTEQEDFWAGEFGTEYISRNDLTPTNISGATMRWSQILRHLHVPPTSALELGANVGLNMHALKRLLPEIDLEAVEINPNAAKVLREWGKTVVHEASLLDFTPTRQYELTFTSTVLIHINPEFLSQAYKRLYEASSRYICIAEYHNPTPVEVTYRGHTARLFKRNFAGELLDTYPDLRLREYGFFYSRDRLLYSDDINWFLLEKQPA